MSKSWPGFVVTTVRGVHLVVGGVERVLHQGKGLYYGLSWDDKTIYVLARGGGSLPGHPGILALSSDYTCEPCDFAGSFLDGHQIHCDGPQLYVTSTTRNSVEVVDLATHVVTEKNWTQHTTDENHINSIWKDDDGFWFSYHNWPQRHNIHSELVKVDLQLTKVLESHTIGYGTHNVVRIGNLLYTCSSSGHSLIVYDLTTHQIVHEVPAGYWLRGIGITDDVIVLGATTVSGDRTGRLTGDSEVFLLDRHTLEVLDTKTLKDTGSIYDLRLVTQPDYAHNGIPFPGNI